MNSLMGDMTTTISWTNILPEESFLWKKEGVTHPPLFEIQRGRDSDQVPPGIKEFTSYCLGSVNFAISLGNVPELFSALTGAIPQVHPKMYSLFIEELQGSTHRLLSVLQQDEKHNGVFFHPKADFSQTYIIGVYDTDLEAREVFDETIRIADSGKIEKLKLLNVKEDLFVFEEDTREARQLRTYLPESPWEQQDQPAQAQN